MRSGKSLLLDADSLLYGEQAAEEMDNVLSSSVRKTISNEVGKQISPILKSYVEPKHAELTARADKSEKVLEQTTALLKDDLVRSTSMTKALFATQIASVKEGIVKSIRELETQVKTLPLLSKDDVESMLSERISLLTPMTLSLNQTIESEKESEEVTSLSVQRKNGLIEKIVTNRGDFTVERDSVGLITNVVKL